MRPWLKVFSIHLSNSQTPFIMKNVMKIKQLIFVAFMSILFISVSGCTEDQVIPASDFLSKDLKISFRADGPVSNEGIKQKVSDRDNIPLVQILTCSYNGQTTQGYWEYHLTTLYNGPKIYTVTKIIGDTNDGF